MCVHADQALYPAHPRLKNALLSTLNTLVLVYQVSRFPLEAQSLGWKQYAGAALFAIGMAAEFGSEETRRQFKAKPENKGKVANTGLFGVVRHPNVRLSA